MGPSYLPTSEDLGPGSESSGGIWSWRFPRIWPGRGSLGLALHCRWLPAWPCAVPRPLQASVGAGDHFHPGVWEALREQAGECHSQEHLDSHGEDGSETGNLLGLPRTGRAEVGDGGQWGARELGGGDTGAQLPALAARWNALAILIPSAWGEAWALAHMKLPWWSSLSAQVRAMGLGWYPKGLGHQLG